MKPSICTLATATMMAATGSEQRPDLAEFED